MTRQEAEALYRLSRSPDGKVFIARLQRIKAKRQEMDLNAEGSTSDKNKGRVLEILDLEREFQDAAPEKRKPVINQQKRFA